jgi:uncharacterized protein YdaU (DUF1376 family)
METASGESSLPKLPIFDRSPEDRMHYVQWYFLEFLEGVRGLKPDQIGIYSVILPLIYASMGMLRDDDRYIAGHCQCDVRTYKKIKAQLIALGKISVRDGYICNDRAIKEIARFCATAKLKRAAALEREAKKRGTRTPCAQHAQDVRTPCASYAPTVHTACIENSEIGNDNNGDLTTALPGPSTQKEKEKESTPLPPEGGQVCVVAAKAAKKPRKLLAEDDGSFDRFWAAYPRKEAKKGARRAWQNLSAENRTAAIAAVPAFSAKMARKEERYIPHAATWLNGERFEDFTAGAAPAVVDIDEHHRRLVRQFLHSDEWEPEHGPKPGMPGSIVSADLLAEVRESLARPRTASSNLVTVGGGHARAA